MPQNETYHLEREGFFSRNIELMAAHRKGQLTHEKVKFPEEFTFTSFNSLADFQNRVKAPIVLPIIYSTLILNSALNAVKNFVFMLGHCITLDFEKADDFLAKVIVDVFFHTFGFVLCAITDTVMATLLLLTNILATSFFYISSFFTGNDVLAEKPILEEEGDYAATFLETKVADIDKALSTEAGLEAYANNQPTGFFQSFSGHENDNLPMQIKATILVPTYSAAGVLGAVLGLVKHVSLAAVNLTVLDLELCAIDFKLALHDTEVGLYLTISGILDTLYVATQLVTRTIGTLEETAEEWIRGPGL